MIYIGYDQVCCRITQEDEKVTAENVPSLSCNNDKADTRICFHVAAINKRNTDIVVRASDTDIVVILLSHIHNFQSNIWLECGTEARRNHRLISLSEIARSMGPNLCKALPAFHSFTGSDFTSAFERIGKIRPLSLLENSSTFEDVFIKMANSSRLETDTFQSLCQYTAAMYGRPNSTLSQARFEIFERVYKPSRRGNPLSKLEGIDGSSLPPCEAELLQHAKRASFVSKMWTTSDSPEINQLPSEGWELHNGEYIFV